MSRLGRSGSRNEAPKGVERQGQDSREPGHGSALPCRKACEAENIRAIISAENMKLVGDVQVKFDVKPDKLFLFDKVTGERLCFSMTK